MSIKFVASRLIRKTVSSCWFIARFAVEKMGKGQNYKNHNVENQKELRKLRRRSERRKCPSIFHKSDQKNRK
jgi:hypothetical protein